MSSSGWARDRVLLTGCGLALVAVCVHAYAWRDDVRLAAWSYVLAGILLTVVQVRAAARRLAPLRRGRDELVLAALFGWCWGASAAALLFLPLSFGLHWSGSGPLAAAVALALGPPMSGAIARDVSAGSDVGD